jgi:ribosomal-protein-alanine N-acetyltransferase
MGYDDFFQGLPVIETDRLILRQITQSTSDGRDSLEFINDYSVYRFWGLYDEALDKNGHRRPKKKIKLDYHYNATMKEYKARRELCWLMELKDTGKVIGEIVLYDFRLKKQADIGYRINKNYWGKGFAPEAGAAMVKTAFELMDLNRLQIRCFTNNHGSIRVAQKLGFAQEGMIRQGAIVNVMTDYYIFGLIRQDYINNPISNTVKFLSMPGISE